MTAQLRAAGRGKRGPSSRVMVIVGLAVFIAVDVVLIALALGWGREVPQSLESKSPTQTAVTDDHSNDTEPKAESSPEEHGNSSPIAPRLISVVSETVAWRSEGGPCDEPGSLELTVDGGETWGSAYPAIDGVGRPLWLSGADYTAVQTSVAFESECRQLGVRTFDSGAAWTQDDQVISNSVLVDPSDRSSVIWGGNTLEGPCENILQVAVTDGVAAVVCEDGSLWSVLRANPDWTKERIEGAVAVAGSEGRWVAARESKTCEGLDIVEFNGDSDEAIACIPTERRSATAMDLSGNTLWLWVEDYVVSTDLELNQN